MSQTPRAAPKVTHAPSGASGGAPVPANGGTPAASTSGAAAASKPFSSRLLGMKFMQRAKDKEKMQEHVEEQELKDEEVGCTSLLSGEKGHV